jgi:UDP-N-acetylmuramate dehydrogenase
VTAADFNVASPGLDLDNPVLPACSEVEIKPIPGIIENVPLAPYSTIRIGGPARYYLRAETIESLREGLAWARSASIPIFILGGGSNTVFADAGFDGLVIHLCTRGMHFEPEATGPDVPSKQESNAGEARPGTVIVRVEAGESWDAFVAETVRRGLQGIECLSGIPGSCGATPIQNVGAYGQEVSETISRVHLINRESGEESILMAQDCDFGYRMSRFKSRDVGKFIVTRVEFRLRPDCLPQLRYGELSRFVSEQFGASPSLSQVRQAVLAIRRKKAMVIEPGEINSRSCGSFFMNPVLKSDRLAFVAEKARKAEVLHAGEEVPAFDCGDGNVKVPAAWLIERSGISKGMRHGGVGVSEKHVLALVNFEQGTQHELIELKSIIQSRVRKVFGIDLEPEPVILS